MAAGAWTLYDNFKHGLGAGTFDLTSATLNCAFLSAGYTPAASHSDYATQADTFEISGISGYAAATLATVEWSDIGSNTIRFDAADFTITASATMKVKYLVIYKQSDNKLIAYCDAETGTTTGVEATQITVNINTSGIFRAA